MTDEFDSNSMEKWFRDTQSYANKLNKTCSTESTAICDSIRNSNSNSMLNGINESLNDLFELNSDDPNRYLRNQTDVQRDRAYTNVIQRPIQRPIKKCDSNNISNSLPTQSFLNENQKLLKFDSFVHFDRENVKLDPIYPNNKQSDYNGIYQSYFGDLDHQKISLMARDLLANTSLNRDDNNDEFRTNPRNSKNQNTGVSSVPSFMRSIFNDSSLSFKNSCELTTNMFSGSIGCSLSFNDQIWQAFNIPTKINDCTDNFQKFVKDCQIIAKKENASYTWSGQLPKRNRNKNPIYSSKVFLGGIPYDLTDSDLHLDFARFGPIQIQWPAANVKSAIDGAAANKAGYVYVILESYDNVAALLNTCTVSYKDLDSGCRWYFNMNSRRTKMKEVQVIPFDIGDRFYMKNGFHGQMDHSKTVFVGALHGMLSADGLAKVMDDLFGGVIFAGLDTDKYKYPLGSGRVSFDNDVSYKKAVSAAFVEIKSSRFKKKIQIDPYIENESICHTCKVPQQSPVFCRDNACFRYYCRSCWDAIHSDKEFQNHRPIIKNKIK